MINRSETSQRFSAHSHVLAVGRSHYDMPLATLPAVETEITEIVEALTDPLGCAIPRVNVTHLVGTDCSREAVLAHLDAYASTLHQDDILVVYFAGHGKNSDTGFELITNEDDLTTLDSATLDNALRRIPTRGILMVLDCCGGGGFAERAPGFFQSLGDREFRILLSSTRENQSSWELRNPPRSLFTRRLLSVITGQTQLDPSGGVYLTELLSYLQTSVVEDSRKVGKLQEPIFSGAYSQDPLLFLHRDLTLAKVKVRYAKVTQEQMVKRIRLSGALIIAAALFVTGCLWAWMDSHRYLSLDNDQVVLWHGYPEWTGFGLPVEQWQFDIKRSHIKATSILLDGRAVVIGRREDPIEYLMESLNASGQLATHLWASEAPGQLSSGVLADYFLDDDDAGFILEANMLSDQSVDFLAELAGSADAIVAYQALAALAFQNPEFVATVLQQRLSRPEEVGNQLNVVADWSAPCTPSVESWLHAYAAADANYLFYPTVVDASLRSGCTLKIENVLSTHTRQLRDAAYGFRLANPSEAAALRTEFAEVLREQDRTLNLEAMTAKQIAVLHRFVRAARYLGTQVCPLNLHSVFEKDLDAATDVLALLLRGCEDARIVTLDSMRVVVEVDRRKLTFPIGQGADIQRIIEVLETFEYPERDAFYRTVMNASNNLDVVRIVAEQLSRIGASLPEKVADHWDRPDVQIALMRYAAQTEPEAVVQRLVPRLSPGVNVDYLTFTNILSDAAKQFLQIAAKMETTDRVLLETLHGTPERVVQLLNSPSYRERETAGHYVVLRTDRHTILTQASDTAVFAPRVLLTVRQRLVRLDQMLEDLRSMPDWACRWRLDLIQRQRSLDYGLARAVSVLGSEICQIEL